MQDAHRRDDNAKAHERDARAQQAECALRERMLVALRQHPEGETKTALARAAGMSGEVAGKVLQGLVEDGLVVEVQITKAAGNNSRRSHAGFRLHHVGATAAPESQPDDPDEPDE